MPDDASLGFATGLEVGTDYSHRAGYEVAGILEAWRNEDGMKGLELE